MLRTVLFAVLALVAATGFCQEPTPQENALWKAMHKKDLSDLRKILDGGWDLTKLTNTGSTPLHWASGSWPPVPDGVIPLLLEHGAKIEQEDSEGRTPLMLAAQNFNVAATKLLIANQANVKATDKNGNHPIHYCVFWTQYDMIIGEREDNCAQIVRLLVEAGEDVNARGAELRTPLMLAAGYWHLPSVKALIELKADLDLEDKGGEKAITWPSLMDPKGDIAQALIKAGAKLGFLDYLALGDTQKALETMPEKGAGDLLYSDGRTPLMIAANRGSLEVVRQLVERGADVNRATKEGVTPLHYATGTSPSRGQMGYYWREATKPEVALPIVRFLLEKGAKLEANSEMNGTPLYWAVHLKSPDVALELLRRGASTQQDMLYEAVSSENPRIVEALLARMNKESIDSEESSFDLAVILHKRAPQYLPMFLEAGFDPGMLYPSGGSPLMTAAWNRDIEGVKLLVSKGAKVKARDKKGHTAIMEARSWEVFKFLLNKGGNPLEIAPDGYSPIFFSDAKTLGYLLKKGLKPNIRMKDDGYTPLLQAAEMNDLEKVRVLLANGADISAKSKDGRDVFKIAERGQAYKVLEFLEEYKKKKGRSL